MIPNPYMRRDELPPRPDPETGEPRPPQAPAFRSSRPARTKQPFPNGSYSSADEERPTRPEDGGPALVWKSPDQFRQVKVGALGFVVLALGVFALQGFDRTWMSFALPWLVILVGSVLVGLRARDKPIAVGAEWLRAGRERVQLYELTEIGTTRWKSELFLLLTDRDGRRLGVNAEELRAHPPMYDLVYNGMLHSAVAGGAETDAYGVLGMPRPAEEDQ